MSSRELGLGIPPREDYSWLETRDEDVLTKLQGQPEDSKEKKLANHGSACSVEDICRICHMGGFPAVSGSQPMWEWQTHGVESVASEISTLSCYSYLGPLISSCRCRGTVGLVHAECLERWLTESGHTRCEICGHKYLTKRVPRHGILRSVWIWFKTVVATRQMVLDLLYLLVTTPLALFSCYVCALAVKMILESGFYDIPWMVVAMLPTCSLTLIAYWGWLITLGRYKIRLHSRRWRRFWRNNFVVRLLPDNELASLVNLSDCQSPRPPETIRVGLVTENEENVVVVGSYRDREEANDYIEQPEDAIVIS